LGLVVVVRCHRGGVRRLESRFVTVVVDVRAR
jgi:hypothetical protein